MFWIAYVTVGAVVWIGVAVSSLIYMDKEFPSLGIDGLDYMSAVFLGFFAGLVWPLTLIGIAMGTVIANIYKRYKETENLNKNTTKRLLP